MKLVIAEKPSVAINIAKVLGASTKKDGYYEGNGYKVSWCVGHLVQLANPDSYDSKYAKWVLSDLPIVPEEYKYEITKATKAQFTTLKKLMADKTIDTVINACDAGREGESIFRLVYNKANCKKKMQRLWISSLEDNAIKEGFNNLKDGKNFDSLYNSALARSIADWLVGINLSRLYSCKYSGSYSVGRVQTPTLAMITKRDYEIENFEKKKYYTVTISTKDFSLSTQRIDDEEVAEALKNVIPNTIELTEVIEKEKITKPDKLYDLTTLQREANKIYGYSAKQTLDYLQSLYEKKLVTYPRTDSRYLTEDKKNSILKLLREIESDFRENAKNFESIFDSSKVSDHDAIIITLSSLKKDLSNISNEEKNVFELVKLKLLMACSDNLIENTTKATYKYKDFDFTANGKVLVEEGYTKYLKEIKENKNKNEDISLPKLKEGDKFDVQSKDVNVKYTQPPKHYTEDTLLKAMEVAGSEALDKDIEIERSGLGTPATRAGIIENLIYKGYITRDKKNLISTKKGETLVKLVAEEIKSDETTVTWEMKLSDIAKDKLSKDDFLTDITTNIKSIINLYK